MMATLAQATHSYSPSAAWRLGISEKTASAPAPVNPYTVIPAAFPACVPCWESSMTKQREGLTPNLPARKSHNRVSLRECSNRPSPLPLATAITHERMPP